LTASEPSRDGTAPRVSVVIPAFDSEETIGRALDSVAAQTDRDLEIIVVDDASRDRTAEVVTQWNGRATLIRHPHNRGAAAAKNTGIAAARGRWIAFLDSDDTWKQDKLARQIELMETARRAVRACATGYHLHRHGRELTFNPNFTRGQFPREIFFGCTISPGSTLLVDRQVFDEIGMFDETFRRLEDWDWLLRFTKAYEMGFVPQPLADVYVAARPRPQDIERTISALDRICQKHWPNHLLTRMRLWSSILVEKAAVFYRVGKPLHAAAYVIAALSIYPLRNLAFFRMLWRSAKRVCDRKFRALSLP
jgi:glycosyltransferase involved in cell wall biosynthesis